MRFSSPLQEEPIVTLQAAFVGRDGFVIASDTKALGGFLYRSSATNKILAPKGNIVCAFSGNDLSAAIAQRLVDSAPDEFESEHAIATFLLTKGAEFAKRLGEDPSGQLIIAAVPHIHKLWRVFFFNEPAVTTIETKVYGGDEKTLPCSWVSGITLSHLVLKNSPYWLHTLCSKGIIKTDWK